MKQCIGWLATFAILLGLPIPAPAQDAPKGTKVLYAWDRAGIDFLQWHHWKQWGVYFISLQKANTSPRLAAPICSCRASSKLASGLVNRAARFPPECAGERKYIRFITYPCPR